MPPPRAMPPPCKRRERRHKECYMCNVCDKCYTSRERLTRHIARHFAGLSSTTTIAQLAAARMHLPDPPAEWSPASDQLQAAGLSTTTIAPRAAAMVAGMPAEAVEAAAARLGLGKSVYFLLCYFSFNILMRNESHFLIEMSPISHYLGITSH